MRINPKTAFRIAIGIAAIAYVVYSQWHKPEAAKTGDSKVLAPVEKVDVSRKLGRLVFRPCSLANGAETLSAFCSSLDVPENHAEPNGRKIRLALA